jgi:asparaginyl-tRNA synthetase
MSFNRDKLTRLSGPWAKASSALITAVTALGYKPFLAMPTIVGVTGACEQIPTMYTADHYDHITNPEDLEYGKKAFLAQSGQLQLEMVTVEEERVWTVIPSSRKEDPGNLESDRRRLRQFSLFEIEFRNSVTDPEAALTELIFHLRTLVSSMYSAVNDHCPSFERMTYTHAIQTLRSCGFGINWGDDITGEHEKFLCNRLGGAVFVTHYPRHIKFFNMKTAPQSDQAGFEKLISSLGWNGQCSTEVVLSTDMLLPGVGESAGAAVRETDPNLLLCQLCQSDMYGMAREAGVRDVDFAWYINEHIIESERTEDPIATWRKGMESGRDGRKLYVTSGIPMHSGAGLGMNRIMQSILNLDDIREATPYVVNAEVGSLV